MEHLNRRHAVTLGLSAAAAAPLFASATSAKAAGAPNYGPTEGRELSPGRRLVEIGEIPSDMGAYKSIKIVDVVYQPGAGDPTEAVMDSDMVCYILAGEFSIKKAGKEPYTVKEGDFYTCGKGKTDKATNIGSGVGVHRIVMLMSA
jgi:mannose-6-phosphate isomerase-like protein (cupin superfamily)